MRNRVVTVAILVGAVGALVTFLGAARMSGDDGKTAKDAPKIISPVKNGSKGVVTFGTVDVDNGIGLIPLFPDAFPQPSKVKEIFAVEGQTVSKGQVLAELENDLADFAVAEAKAGLDQAKGAKARADVAMRMAEQAIEAHQYAIRVTQTALEGKATELEAARDEYTQLKKKLDRIGAQNDPELTIANKKIDAAAKALEAEQIKLEGMKAITPTTKKEEAAAAQLEAAAAVAKQQATYDKAIYGQKLSRYLTAPSDGKIVRSLIARGLMFGPQTRQPAFLFQPAGALIARAEVDQEFAARVAKGMDAVLTDDGNPSLKWTGKVIRLSEGFLPKRSAAGTPEGLMLNDSRVLECIVSIETADANNPVRIGQRVKVSLGVE